MIIDAHQHFWKLDRGDYEWPTPDLEILYKDYLPEHLLSILKKNKIDKTILVQTTPTIEETKFLLDLYNQYDFIAGVVGWIDLDSKGFATSYYQFKKNSGFVGIRPMLQNLKNDNWILRPQVKENIQLLVEDNFPIDLLIYPRHLPYVLELLQQFPSLRAVINHAAKPNICEKQWEGWAEYLKSVSAYENVFCKLSGLVTEANHMSWRIDDFREYIQYAISCFGIDRIMFGSDWPVCNVAASYEDVIHILKSNLPVSFSSSNQEKLFGQNTKCFYSLNRYLGDL